MKFQSIILIIKSYMLLFSVVSYSQHYIAIDDLVKICSYNKREDVNKLSNLLKTGNYSTLKLYANANSFKDSNGNRISTTIDDTKRSGFVVRYSIKNPSEQLIKDYKDHLKNNYTNIGYNDRGDYIKEGKYLLTIITINSEISGHRLIITVRNNSSADYAVPAIKIKGTNQRIITSFTNSRSVFYFKKGQKYKLTASGSVLVGPFAGKTGPNGIDGLEIYNYVGGFKHGSLLGKLGKDGTWFLIGSQKTIFPSKNAFLYVKVNDIDPSNNQGSFILNYSTENSLVKKVNKKTGCISGNCIDGYGIFTYNNGDSYLGFFKKSQRHGFGEYLGKVDNYHYSGNWEHGFRQGYGKYYWKSSNKLYIGEWHNGVISGHGYKINSNTSITRGVWSNGIISSENSYNSNGVNLGCVKGNCKNGFGKKILANKASYEGFYVDGIRHVGEFSYVNGDKYEGKFNGKGLREGTGYYTYKNGDTYHGGWLNDNKHGKGVYRYANGKKFYQNWNNNTLITSIAKK